MTGSQCMTEAAEQRRNPDDVTRCLDMVDSGKAAILYGVGAAIMMLLALYEHTEGHRIATLFDGGAMALNVGCMCAALRRYIEVRVYHGVSELSGGPQPCTVGELIAELGQHAPDQLVLVEGQRIGFDPLALRSHKGVVMSSPPDWMGKVIDPEHPAMKGRVTPDEVREVLVLGRVPRSLDGGHGED